MSQISVLPLSADPSADTQEFDVGVTSDDKTKTTHQVLVRQETYQRLTGGLKSAEELVKASFEFLLEREPKESILKRFDLDKIQGYFPEYETVISAQLAR